MSLNHGFYDGGYKYCLSRGLVRITKAGACFALVEELFPSA